MIVLQGGAVIRAAKRMAEKIGYDPETGLHSTRAPSPKKEPFIIDDGKVLTSLSLCISMAY